MSTAEAPAVPGPATGGGALAGVPARRGVVRPWLRLLAGAILAGAGWIIVRGSRRRH